LQIAFNKRILEKESEVVHINSGLSDFLLGLDLSKPTFVCVNVSDPIQGPEPVFGELSENGGRK
jgi:hypothetical protein